MNAVVSAPAPARPMIPCHSTAEFYDTNAESYAALTRGATLSATHDRFLAHVPAGGRLLDAGCGAGRDLKAFIERGYAATGLEASPVLAPLASAYANAPVCIGRLEDIPYEAEFEGAWACASLLHLPRAVLPTALAGLRRALVPGGVLYACVQRGEGEATIGDGRFYAYYSATEFSARIEDAGFTLLSCVESDDKLGRANAPVWIDVLARAV